MILQQPIHKPTPPRSRRHIVLLPPLLILLNLFRPTEYVHLLWLAIALIAGLEELPAAVDDSGEDDSEVGSAVGFTFGGAKTGRTRG